LGYILRRGSAISSKAILKTTNPYKYNAGSELEEELNYYNTFYRKHDAQIGRFTGVDIRSEESAAMSVYNFGANNPVMYNDPLGDKYSYMDQNGNKWHGADPLAGTGGASQSYQPGFGFNGFGDGIGGGGGGGGRDYGGFWSNFLSNAAPNKTYVNTPGGTGTAYNFKYSNESGTVNYVTNTDHGESWFDPTENGVYDLIASNISLDFNAALLDGMQLALDGIGMTEIPFISQGAELISAGISFGRGDNSGGLIGLGSMIPIGGKFFEGMKVARNAKKLVTQGHHLIPNAVFKANKSALKDIGWVQSHTDNLMNLPVPFHGNHPAYNKYVTDKMASIIQNGNLNDIIRLQNDMRTEVQSILSGGFDKLNNYYKSLGY